ncbi:MAG TPA: mandelate racemase/muconate lactonizing enzyme family protein [Candidatus Dormibacteraeota bacterium]|jgi:galactonate dehydratase|nr:mandelate racemase/muconate lactonizing enzyme family protein [Candidatus Dormibacteraeota bacterium]
MRIAEAQTLVLGSSWRNFTIVRLRTDDGLEGVGEVRMVNHTKALLGYLEYALPAHVIGSDPFDLEALAQRMWRSDYERAGGVVMSGLAAVEIACWDIIGKALSQPIYRLLGGAVRDRIKAYANGWYTVERTPQEFHAAARRVVERGYLALKVDPFGAGTYELDAGERRRALELVEAVRDAVGPDADLLIEMHGRFAPAAAVSIARDLERINPAWIEEPVPPENLAALERVRREVRIPVASGERIHVRHEFRELFERQAADILQVDITGCGGLLEAKKIAGWAEAYYLLMAPHNVGGPISTAAALHLAAATPNFKIQEHFNDFGEAHVKQSAPGNPEVEDGYFSLPSGPGLGVTLDQDLVAAHPAEEIQFDLFAEDWQFRQGRQIESD